MKAIKELQITDINLTKTDNLDSVVGQSIIELLQAYIHGLKHGYFEHSLKNYLGFKIETLNFDVKISLVEYEDNCEELKKRIEELENKIEDMRWKTMGEDL